jgi:hypothetical protein
MWNINIWSVCGKAYRKILYTNTSNQKKCYDEEEHCGGKIHKGIRAEDYIVRAVEVVRGCYISQTGSD